MINSNSKNNSFLFRRTLSLKAMSVLVALVALSFSSLAFVPVALAAPTTFVVNSTTDLSDTNPGDGMCETINVGECTLRAAIEEANTNPGADTIEFNIPGDPSTVHIFQPATSYPQITEEVHLNGYSQPGANVNTAISPNPMNSIIKIELQGSESPDHYYAGLLFGNGSNGSSVSGLAINSFSSTLLNLGMPSQANIAVFAEGIVIAGNYIGLHADGTTPSAQRNSTGIGIDSVSNNYRVGGTNPADRNIIYTFSESNISAGIFGGAVGGQIYGNYFGMAKDGVTDLTSGTADTLGLQGPFSLAINLVNGTNDPQVLGNTVGGANTGEKNLVAGVTMAIGVNSHGNIVQGNILGTDYLGNVKDDITNGVGINIVAGSYNLIGGTNAGEGNLVAGFGGVGIGVASFDLPGVPLNIVPEKNTIVGNSIHGIKVFNYPGFGTNNVGIDHYLTVDNGLDFIPDVFTERGPNTNDIGDSDSGPNNKVNFPILNSAVQNGSNLEVNLDLDASGSDDNQYRVEFFANDEATIFGYGPGQVYLGFVDVQSGDSIDVTIPLGSLNIEGKSLSATTTQHFSFVPWGYGSTSEFAQNIKVGSTSDFDADGIPDSTEDNAANSGDGNNDGILDKLQSVVSSYTIGGIPVTFVTQGCSANGNVSSLPSNAIDKLDAGFAYPYGLTDFSLNCSRGDSVTVTKYIYDDNAADVADYHVRKFIPATGEYIEVDQATIESQDINGRNALVMSYSLVDGGQYDDDGTANGVIVDPVGLAQVFTSSSNTDNTGQTGTNNAGNNSGSNSGTKSASGVLSYTGSQYVLMTVLFALVLVVAGSLLFFGQRTLLQRRRT